MKNFIIILFALFAISCSDDDSPVMNEFETNMFTLDELDLMDPYQGFGFNFYAEANSNFPDKLESVPNEYSHFSIRKYYSISGLKFDNGASESVIGTMKLFNSVYEKRTSMISNKISGQFENMKGELIFYYGDLDLNLKTKKVMGKIAFSNGTGEYEGCSGEVQLSGDLNYGYLKIDCNGSMSLSH